VTYSGSSTRITNGCQENWSSGVEVESRHVDVDDEIVSKEQKLNNDNIDERVISPQAAEEMEDLENETRLKTGAGLGNCKPSPSRGDIAMVDDDYMDETSERANDGYINDYKNGTDDVRRRHNLCTESPRDHRQLQSSKFERNRTNQQKYGSVPFENYGPNLSDERKVNWNENSKNRSPEERNEEIKHRVTNDNFGRSQLPKSTYNNYLHSGGMFEERHKGMQLDTGSHRFGDAEHRPRPGGFDLDPLAVMLQKYALPNSLGHHSAAFSMLKPSSFVGGHSSPRRDVSNKYISSRLSSPLERSQLRASMMNIMTPQRPVEIKDNESVFRCHICTFYSKFNISKRF